MINGIVCSVSYEEVDVKYGYYERYKPSVKVNNLLVFRFTRSIIRTGLNFFGC